MDDTQGDLALFMSLFEASGRLLASAAVKTVGTVTTIGQDPEDLSVEFVCMISRKLEDRVSKLTEEESVAFVKKCETFAEKIFQNCLAERGGKDYSVPECDEQGRVLCSYRPPIAADPFWERKAVPEKWSVEYKEKNRCHTDRTLHQRDICPVLLDLPQAFANACKEGALVLFSPPYEQTEEEKEREVAYQAWIAERRAQLKPCPEHVLQARIEDIKLNYPLIDPYNLKCPRP